MSRIIIKMDAPKTAQSRIDVEEIPSYTWFTATSFDDKKRLLYFRHGDLLIQFARERAVHIYKRGQFPDLFLYNFQLVDVEINAEHRDWSEEAVR